MSAPDAALSRPSLKLFGPIALRVSEGEPAVSLPSRRCRGLLAFAALQPQGTATRSRLAGLFWSDRPDAQARASLRQSLTELRGALGPLASTVLEILRDTLRVRLEAVAVDAVEMTAAIDTGDADALAALLERIGTDVLCDEPAVSDIHQEWLDQARSHIEDRLAKGVRTLVDSLFDSDPARARALAIGFLRRQPLDEGVVAATMRLDTALGSAAAAVLRHAALKTALARELKVNPGPAVQAALRAALASAMSETAGTPAGTLSALSAPLVVMGSFVSTDEEASGQISVVRDEILSALSRFREFAVVSHEEAADPSDPALEPWLQRGDAYMLTGSAQKLNGHVRFVTRLIRLQDRRLVWSDRGTLGSAAGDSAIETAVDRTVGAVLPMVQEDLLPRLKSVPHSVYGRYLQARQNAAGPSTYEAARAAAEDLERLIADEPELILAYPILARLYNTDFNYTRAGSSGPEERERAFVLSKTALSQDRGHVHGYSVMGWCYLWKRNWQAARKHFQLALDLNPYNSQRLMEVGFGSLFLGEIEMSRSLLERCLLLHPFPQDRFYTDLGLLEIVSGNYDAARDHLDMIASPTVFDDLYVAVTAVLAGEAASEQAAVAGGRVKAIWPPQSAAAPAEVAAWFADHHPFSDAATGARIETAVRHVMQLSEAG